MRSTDHIVPVASKTKSKNRRKHRRVRSDWSGCECPVGSEYRATPRVTRGWTCIKKTARGPRFVRATCSTSNTKSLPSERKMLPASTLFGVRSDKKSAGKQRDGLLKKSVSKKRPSPLGLTGASCGCPEGAKRVQTKRGSRCHRNGKFVKTACVTGG